MKRSYVKSLFLATAFLLLFISILNYRDLSIYRKEGQSIKHSNRILATLAIVLSDLEDAQTSRRGYQVMSDTTYLHPYHRSLRTLPVELKTLDSLVKDDAQLAKLVDTLEQLTNNQITIITNTLTGIQRNGTRTDEDRNSLLMEDWKNRDEIRKVAGRIREAQEIYFRQRESGEERFMNIAPVYLLIYGLVAIAGLTFLFSRVLDGLHKRKAAEDDLNDNIKVLKKEVSIREFTQKTLRSVLDNSLNGIMAFRAVRNGKKEIEDFEWILANQVSLNAMGKSGEDLLKRRLLETIPGYASEELVAIYRDVVETGKPTQFEKYYGDEDASKWFNISAVRLEDGLVVTFADITEQKLQFLLTEERELLLNEAEHVANMGSWKWTIKNDHLVWSDGLYKILGYKPGTHVPSWNSFLENVHAADRLTLEDFLRELKVRRNGLKMDYCIELAGQTRYLSIITNPTLRDESLIPEVLGTVIDITDRKIYENQLKQHTEELKRSNEDLEQFAYVASHDLQEPLRKIIAFGDRLVTKYQHELEGPGTDYISRMQSAAARMQLLIEDLLAYSRVSRKMNRSESLDMDSLLTEVIDDLESQIKREHAQITVCTLPDIRGERTQIKRLFQNLLSNAVKFHKPGMEPVISIQGRIVKRAEIFDEFGLALSGSKYSCFKIQDNGIGFDEKYTDKVFHIFQRLHGRSEYEGTGIGLSICRKIVTNHGGFITAISKENDGAEFIVILPVDKELS